jgi:hypothetical protein
MLLHTIIIIVSINRIAFPFSSSLLGKEGGKNRFAVVPSFLSSLFISFAFMYPI